MNDEHKWRLAVARFKAMRSNLPGYIKENLVNEYHGILEAMSEASGEEMVSFRIPREEVKPRVTGRRAGVRGRPGSTFYSTENYCDQNLFERALETLAISIPTIEAKARGPLPVAVPENSKDYWAMTTQQLEELAGRYGIGGYADRNFGVDRNIIIQQLLERDHTLNPPPPATHHTIHVGNMYGSSIQQNSPNATSNVKYTGSDLEEIVEHIRAILPQLQLTPEDRGALEADAATIEVQAKAGRIRSPIVMESLISTRGILERIASGALTTGLLHLISQYMQHHR